MYIHTKLLSFTCFFLFYSIRVCFYRKNIGSLQQRPKCTFYSSFLIKREFSAIWGAKKSWYPISILFGYLYQTTTRWAVPNDKMIGTCPLVRGHSTTTWTKFYPILTPSSLEWTSVDNLEDTYQMSYRVNRLSRSKLFRIS